MGDGGINQTAGEGDFKGEMCDLRLEGCGGVCSMKSWGKKQRKQQEQRPDGNNKFVELKEKEKG